MDCFEDSLLLDIAGGRRAIEGAIAEHLASCTECRLVLAAAARGAGETLRVDEAPPDGEASWDELGTGVVVGERYVLDRFLGSGSMGIVWSARREDGTEVALKIARGSDPEIFHRLEREARITAALDHPNIVRTLDVLPATESRGTVLVMPLLVGESLEAHLRREPKLDVRRAARIVVPIANALAAAHARGIVHRDLKPENVFLTDDRVVVLDFGIAKLTPSWGPHSKLTRTGAVLGTPRYMAPEQVFEDAEIDARADVWATGALLFRLLSGHTPVRGETLGAIIRELRGGSVDDLTMHVDDTPSSILELVRSALVVSKESRLERIDRFSDVLAAYYR